MASPLSGEKRYQLPNVSAVPQLSPFRYPGGKSRWYELIDCWTDYVSPDRFIEPFAGGAHAGLAAAIEGWVDEVVLVEKDGDVQAVWETILNGGADWLISKIKGLELTREEAKKVVRKAERSDRHRALATIVQNRVSRGGITAPGAGWLKNGENKNGTQSRWYPSTLAERIKDINRVRDRIKFIPGDAFDITPKYQKDKGAVFFIDPPYPRAGERLYKHSDVDHEEVFRLAREARGEVLLTYDNSEEVMELVRQFRFRSEEVIASTSHHREKVELLISDDLKWMNNMPQ